MAGGSTNNVEFLTAVTQRFLAPRHRERLANPGSDGQMTRLRQALDLTVFCVLKNDLKPFSHVVSLNDSFR